MGESGLCGLLGVDVLGLVGVVVVGLVFVFVGVLVVVVGYVGTVGVQLLPVLSIGMAVTLSRHRID